MLRETKTLITSTSQLHPGDHIAQPGQFSTAALPYWHHAIVAGLIDEDTVMVIHNSNGPALGEEEDPVDAGATPSRTSSRSSSCPGKSSVSEAFARAGRTNSSPVCAARDVGRVQKGTFSLFVSSNGQRCRVATYRCEYSAEERVYTGVEIVERAFGKLDECTPWCAKYNCEHHATWCVTGQAVCYQYQEAKRRVVYPALSKLAEFALRAVVEKCRKTAQTAAAREAAENVADGSARAGYAYLDIVGSGIEIAAALNVVHDIIRQYKSEEITWEELKQKLKRKGLVVVCSAIIVRALTSGAKTICLALGRPQLIEAAQIVSRMVGPALGYAIVSWMAPSPREPDTTNAPSNPSPQEVSPTLAEADGAEDSETPRVFLVRGNGAVAELGSVDLQSFLEEQGAAGNGEAREDQQEGEELLREQLSTWPPVSSQHHVV